jgi:hypothetical protein
MVKYLVHYLKRKDIAGSGPRSRSTPSIFVAYAFDAPQGEAFRARLERQLKQSRSLRIEVLDGHGYVGDLWKTKIRDKLDKAWLVVADLSLLRPDVLFECGLAWGMGKKLCPAVGSANLIDSLPEWMTDLLVGRFDTDAGWRHLVNSISIPLGSGKRRPKGRQGVVSPDPTSIVVLGGTGDQAVVGELVETMAKREGLQVQRYDPGAASLDSDDPGLIQAIRSASLVVSCVDGTESDSLTCFSTGLVMAKPTAGASRYKHRRRMILVLANGQTTAGLPSAALKAKDYIVVVNQTTLQKELATYGKKYHLWKKKLHEVVDF